MNMKKDKVVVLLSAYNGEKFLREQIDSILSQEDVDLDLFIRNDGSKDETISILSDYENKHTNVKVFNEENVGLACSFMQLLYYAGLEYDYYCFADQDDVWLKNKIISGIKLIGQKDTPMLYSSNQQLVDCQLNNLSIRYDSPADTSYKQIIANNKISGCTFIWNKQLQKILLDENRRPTPELLRKRIHDVWVAAVASVAGTIVFDMNTYILYRQHESNVVGVRKGSRIANYIKKIRDPNTRCGRSDLAKELMAKYSDLIVDPNILEDIKALSLYKTDRASRKKMLVNHAFQADGESLFSYRIKLRLKIV